MQLSLLKTSSLSYPVILVENKYSVSYGIALVEQQRSDLHGLGPFCREMTLRRFSPFHQIVTRPSHHVCCCQKCIPACCQKRREIGRFQDDDGFQRSPVCEPGCCSCCIFCALLNVTRRLPEALRSPRSSATRPSRRSTRRRYGVDVGMLMT